MSNFRTIQTNFLDGVQSIANYIENGKATYTSTTGWATYADAAGTSPVDGTGGSPSVTISTSNSSPLSGDNSFLLVKDAANRQGQGWSYDFSINSSDRAKVLQIQFDYLLSSGTFTAGSSTTNSDVTVWIYDVTNAVLIQPSTFRLYSNSSTTSSTSIGSFQTASNSTSYRLIFHVGSTSASAYTLKVDNISVSPTNYVYGTPITDWQSYTPTFSAGFGTTTLNLAQYRRVGDSYEVDISVTTGTVAASSATMTLPNGATANSSKMPASGNKRVGEFSNNTASLNATKNGIVLASANSNLLTFSLDYYGATVQPLTSQNGNSAFNSTTIVQFRALIPITGFSSSVQMSDSADTRVVAAQISLNANTAFSANAPIKYDVIAKDTHGSYSSSTGLYTASTSGFYSIKISNAQSVGAGTTYLFKNGSSYQWLMSIPATGTVYSAAASIYLNSGETISVCSNTSVTVQSGSVLQIERISGPSAIAATEKVYVQYTGNGGTALTANVTNTDYTTKVVDSHGAWNGTTFTAPRAGMYLINGTHFVTVATAYAVFSYVNGTQKLCLTNNASATLRNLSGQIFLNAGDILSFRTDTSQTLTNSATVHSISISSQG